MQKTPMNGVTETLEKELGKDSLRANLLEFTRKAFNALPKMDSPRILDIGCGTGIPSIELAKLSNGEVTGIDIKKETIRKMRTRIAEENLSERVKAVHCSLFEMDFPDETFDIIWAEGAIAQIGFREGLQRWRRFIKPGGFMVVHDDLEGADEKERAILASGYKLILKFNLSATVWWERYFLPLKNKIEHLTARYQNNQEIMKQLQTELDEISRYSANPRGSIFFIMRRTMKKGEIDEKNEDSGD